MKEREIIYLLIAAIVVSKIIIGFLIYYLVKRKRELSVEKVKLNRSNIELTAHIKKIEEQQKEIIASENFKLKILSLASHDLRTPFQELVMLFEYADVVQLDDASLKKLMQTIKGQLKSSKNMLDNVLIWTAGQLKDKEYGQTNFDLSEQVRATTELFATQIAAKDLKITNSVAEGPSVIGNIEVFNFVMRNLLSNAIKYSPVSGHVEIGATVENGRVNAIYVQDQGEGIDEQSLSYLKKGQLMESKIGTQQEKGSGLGLSLCRDLLKRVGWSLDMDSEVGKGSRFILVLENNEQNKVIEFIPPEQTGTLNNNR